MTLPSDFSDLSLPFFFFSSFPLPLSIGEDVVNWVVSPLDAADFPSSSLFFFFLDSSELFSGGENEYNNMGKGHHNLVHACICMLALKHTSYMYMMQDILSIKYKSIPMYDHM